VIGLERLVDRGDEIALHGVEVHGLAQPGGEYRHDRLGVVAGPVEPAVDCPLHPAAQRVEQRRGGQRGGRHRHRCLERVHLGGHEHQPGEHTDKHGRDDGVGDHPADDAVDRVQPVLQHRNADTDGQDRYPEVEEIAGHRRS